MKLNTLILTASLGLAAAPGTRADVLFNTVPGPYPNNIRYSYVAYGIAQSFKTGASAVTLDNVVLRMADAVDTSGGFTVNLRSDNGGIPGATLAALAGSANPATYGDYTYTGTVTLGANSVYWVDAEVSAGSGNYSWLKEIEPDPLRTGTSAPGKSVQMGGGIVLYNTGGDMSMQVNVSGGGSAKAPDSGSSALLGLLGLGGLAAWQRRTRQAK